MAVYAVIKNKIGIQKLKVEYGYLFKGVFAGRQFLRVVRMPKK
jgi:hypothetical protein